VEFCVDYQASNTIAQVNNLPISVIEELLGSIGGATIFSKLVLKSSYHQI